MFHASAFAALLIVAPVSAQGGAQTEIPAFTPEENAPVCRGASGYALDFDGARTFLWRPRWIETISENATMRQEAIIAGEAALENGPYSVTHKPRPVPGGSANDYASIGPYWWPDTSSNNGLPYERRDGEVNPERDGPEFDKDRLRNFSNDMRDLALAYRVTGEGRFAEHAVKLARTWFLDGETRMNPNFHFAQGIPGRVPGRGEGIIEASHLSTIAEALGLLWDSNVLTAADKQGLADWYGQFAIWMATSEHGAHEMAKTNNHAVFYDFYLAHFALFAGESDVLRDVASNFPRYRLGVQMDRQGRFIQELQRTRSWHYSHYVVDGAARLATIAECAELDLWNAELPDGRGMATAISFLDRYAGAPESWPFQDTDLKRGSIDRMRDRSKRLSILIDSSTNLRTISDLP